MEVYVYITRALILADSMKRGLKETLRKEKREPPKMKRKKKGKGEASQMMLSEWFAGPASWNYVVPVG